MCGPGGEFTAAFYSAQEAAGSLSRLSVANLSRKSSSGTHYPIANYVSSEKIFASHKLFLATLTKVVEPKYFQEAIKDPLWRKAMADEIHALEANKTWVVEDLPQGKKPISCKWVYQVKLFEHSTIQGRIGDTRRLSNWRVDYNKTFAPVVKMTSLRCFLSVVVANRWDLHQIDVNNAFLHGDLGEEVFMKMPPVFCSNDPNNVYQLKKSLYDLHRAPWQWLAKTLPNYVSMALLGPIRIILYLFTATV